MKFVKSLPKKYELKEFWSLDGDCNGKTHCADMLAHTDTYSAKLDTFWSGVFGQVAKSSSSDKPAEKGNTPIRLYREEGGIFTCSTYLGVASRCHTFFPVVQLIELLCSTLGREEE